MAMLDAHRQAVRLLILSDLHIEAGHFAAPETDADAVVLAGDIAVGLDGLRWARESFQNMPILYVPGNHEYYGAKLEEMAVELRSCARTLGIHYLDNDVVEVAGVRFIGSTLWTDFELFGSGPKSIGDALRAAGTYLCDFSVIRFGTTGLLQPAQTMVLHREARSYIAKALARPFDGPSVVITHHAPSWASVVPRYQNEITSAAFASRLDHLVEQADLWIHGHTHASIDTRIGANPFIGRLICNPRGYPNRTRGGFENPQFDPVKIVEVFLP